MKYKCIVCGVTASTRAQKAALDSARLARKCGATLTYVHVVDVSFLGEKTTDSLSRAFIENSSIYLGMQIVDHATQIAKTEGIAAEKRLARGTVRKSLQKVARELGADLLVLGGDEGRTVFRDVLKLAEIEDLVLDSEINPEVEGHNNQATHA
jgi:nucleotide-binding universal stress UspA family protein